MKSFQRRVKNFSIKASFNFRGVETNKIFIRVTESRREEVKMFCPPYISVPLGHNPQEGGGQNIYMTEERLDLASAPYAHYESFFHQEQKHTISNFIRGRLREASLFDSLRAYAPYTPGLETPLFIKVCYIEIHKYFFSL